MGQRNEASYDWSTPLLQAVQEEAFSHPSWRQRFREARHGRASIHLAILNEPYLQYILDGDKTIESRFSKHRIRPYQKVAEGDILILKRSSGPVVAVCSVTEVQFFELNSAVREMLQQRYTTPLCATDPAFWKERENKNYATLMGVGDVLRLPDLSCGKKDRSGWVTLLEGNAVSPGRQVVS